MPIFRPDRPSLDPPSDEGKRVLEHLPLSSRVAEFNQGQAEARGGTFAERQVGDPLVEFLVRNWLHDAIFL
jgi:hypothetical protein